MTAKRQQGNLGGEETVMYPDGGGGYVNLYLH